MPVHWDENWGLTVKSEAFISTVKIVLNWNTASISHIDPQILFRSVCPRENFMLLCGIRQTLAIRLRAAALAPHLCLQEHLCSWPSCSFSMIGTENGRVMLCFTNRYINHPQTTTVHFITIPVVWQMPIKLLLNPQSCDIAWDLHVKYYLYDHCRDFSRYVKMGLRVTCN